MEGSTASYTDKQVPTLNGLRCPQCHKKKQFFDTKPNIILTSYPAKKNVHCESCGFVGYRTI